MTAIAFTSAEIAALASLESNATITGALSALSAAQAAHVDAKNAVEAARTADTAAKNGVWANVLEIALEVYTITKELPRIREQCYVQCLGEYMSKDFPVATVRSYTSTGKQVLLKLAGKVAFDTLRQETYKEIRDRLTPKGEGVVVWEASQKTISDALTKAKKYLADDADATSVMEAIIELAQGLHQRAEAVKQSKQKTPANAREVNAMREVAESIGKVASVIDNGPARLTGTEG